MHIGNTGYTGTHRNTQYQIGNTQYLIGNTGIHRNTQYLIGNTGYTGMHRGTHTQTSSITTNNNSTYHVLLKTYIYY